MARMRISVSLDIPEGAIRADVLTYVVEAVRTLKRSLRPPGEYSDDDPGDPMFQLDRTSVRGSFAMTRQNKRRIMRCEAE